MLGNDDSWRFVCSSVSRWCVSCPLFAPRRATSLYLLGFGSKFSLKQVNSIFFLNLEAEFDLHFHLKILKIGHMQLMRVIVYCNRLAIYLFNIT
jgi:hypothetical protein